jgi:thiamine monophosphate synthase
MACGCAGIAVVSAILSADDPEAAAHGLLATVANGRSS